MGRWDFPNCTMLSLDQHMDIKHLHKQGHSIRQITRMTGHSRNTVRKVLAAKEAPVFKTPKRSSKLDAFKDYLDARVEQCNLSGVRLMEEIVAMGYKGRYTILKDYLRQKRPRCVEKLTVRFETPPGEQAQCDWGYCGGYEDQEGASHRLYAFVYVLGFSRFMYAGFTTSMHLKSLVRCHQQAFEFCGGWPRTIVYDNMKQVRVGPGKWNPAFMDFAQHYGFVPRTHRPYRPRTKGKVERMVGYVKDNFLNGRSFADLDDLNAQARQWLAHTANRRVHQTTGKRPMDLIGQEQLTALSGIAPYRWVDREPRIVNAEAMVLYQRSHYSVPAVAVGQKVLVEACGSRLAIRFGDTIIAEHPRAQQPGQRVQHQEHHRQRWEALRKDLARQRTSSPKWFIGPGATTQVQIRPLSSYQEVAP
jgi:transposase